MKDEELVRLSNKNAYSEAMEITGKDYKTDKQTNILATVLHMESHKARAMVFKEHGDVYRGIPWIDFLNLAKAYGFIRVFTSHYNESDTHIVLARHDGILMSVNSYSCSYRNEITLNGGSAFFNVQCELKDGKAPDAPPCTSWGQEWETGKPIIPCCMAVHEDAFFAKLRLFKSNGYTFLNPWKYIWYFYIGHNGIESEYREEYKREVISYMPQWVKDMIGSAKKI